MVKLEKDRTIYCGSEIIFEFGLDMRNELTNMVTGWNRSHIRRGRVVEEGLEYRVGYDHGSLRHDVVLLIEPGNKIRLTDYPKDILDFRSTDVNENAQSFAKYLIESRIPFSVKYNRIKKKESEFPFAWHWANQWEYWYTRANYLYMEFHPKLDFFRLCENPGWNTGSKTYVLSKSGFNYYISGIKSEGHVSLARGLEPTTKEDPEGVNMISIGTEEEGKMSIEEINIHKKWFLENLPKLNVGDISPEQALDGYKKFFILQIKKLNLDPQTQKNLLTDIIS